MRIVSMACLAAAAGLLAACGTEREYRPDDFGDSVRAMIEQQTLDPQAGRRAVSTHQGLLGEKAAASLEAWRKGYGPAGQPETAPVAPAAVGVASGGAAGQ